MIAVTLTESLVSLQEGNITSSLRPHKVTKQSEVQVSCWLLAQVQSEETPPSDPQRGMGQGRWNFPSDEPLHGSVQKWKPAGLI